MLRPSAWKDYFRMKTALKAYPIYFPPHPGQGNELTLQQARENFEFFHISRDSRIRSLQEFLHPFGFCPKIDQEGLRAVSEWFDRYGGHLVLGDAARSKSAFATFIPTWDIDHKGLNVVWDVGTYLGEFMSSTKSCFRWDFFGSAGDIWARESYFYFRPCIVYENMRQPIRVMDVVFDVAFKSKRRIGFSESYLDESGSLEESAMNRIAIACQDRSKK